MAANPMNRRELALPCGLLPFEPQWAELVISWVRDAHEAYWLAPKTPPPLTPAHLSGWQAPGHTPYVLSQPASRDPIGYGELNRFERGQRQYWLGHVIIAPLARGRGYGVALTRLLLEEAFERRGARRVSLIVFPQNHAALACYRAAGMHDDGYEWHSFPAYGTREYLIRLVARR
jgi:RimJ/RimL family protein N-acetyltransferase